MNNKFSKRRRALMSKAQSQVETITMTRRSCDFVASSTWTDLDNIFDENNTTYGSLSLKQDGAALLCPKFIFARIPSNAIITNLSISFTYDVHGSISYRYAKDMTSSSNYTDITGSATFVCESTETGGKKTTIINSDTNTTATLALNALKEDKTLLTNGFFLRIAIYCRNISSYTTKIYDITVSLTYRVPQKRILSYSEETALIKGAIAYNGTYTWTNDSNMLNLNSSTYAYKTASAANNLLLYYNFSSIPTDALITKVIIETKNQIAHPIKIRFFRDFNSTANVFINLTDYITLKTDKSNTLQTLTKTFDNTSQIVTYLNNILNAEDILYKSKRFGVEVYMSSGSSTQKLYYFKVSIYYKTPNYT